MTTTLFVGLDSPHTRELAAALSAELVSPPPLAAPDGWAWTFGDDVERFAASLADGPPVDQVIVCTWAEHYGPKPLVDVDPAEWMTEVERTLALWYSVLTRVVERVADGGAMAVVVERPAAIDCAGYAGTTAVAEGLVALTRSCALVHGARGVRVNAIGTEVSTAPEVLLGLAPALPSFPGTISDQVAGAVRMVLSPDASGVSGTLVRADAGRSW
jgi:NAD(P)-dependent dehydrogenase (short-subunit alcohol dehydrogenase family)